MRHLEGEALVGLVSDASENGVQVEELLPDRPPARHRQSGDDQILQFGDPLVLPDLVGQADQKVFHLGLPGGPGSVCRREACPRGIDASAHEQLTACFLVLCAGSGQLGRVQGLSDVVRGGSEENGLRVDSQPEAASSDPFEELPRDVVNCP